MGSSGPEASGATGPPTLGSSGEPGEVVVLLIPKLGIGLIETGQQRA